MRKLVLDTSVLINHWRRCRSGRPLQEISVAEAENWAQRLADIEHSDALVTPVVLEFLCGVVDRHEMRLARAFLRRFRPIDSGKTLVSDWREALRLAERVPGNRRPRDLGDCLIKAIANRLNHEVRTHDAAFPR